MKTELIESNQKSLDDDLDADCDWSALAIFALCISSDCTLHRDQADLVNEKYLYLYMYLYLYLYCCCMHRDEADLVNWNIFSCKTSLASFTTCLRLSMLSGHLDLATNVKCFQKSVTEHLQSCLSQQKTVARIEGTNSFRTITHLSFQKRQLQNSLT